MNWNKEEYFRFREIYESPKEKTINFNASLSSYLKIQDGRFLLVGQNSIPVSKNIVFSSENSFAIKLGVGFIYRHLRIPADSFTDQVFDLSDILPKRKFKKGIDWILSQKDPYSNIQNLIHILKSEAPKDVIIGDFLIRKIIEQPDLQLEKLALETGYSSRQIRRIVLSYTGFSPLLLRRIAKFERSLESILAAQSNPELQMSQIAYSNEYSDQSHMIREMKRFSGNNPSMYLRKMSELSNTIEGTFVKINS